MQQQVAVFCLRLVQRGRLRWSGTGKPRTCWHPVTMETSVSGTKEWAKHGMRQGLSCTSTEPLVHFRCHNWVDFFPTEAKHSGGVRCCSPVQDSWPGLASGKWVYPGNLQPGQLCEGEKTQCTQIHHQPNTGRQKARKDKHMGAADLTALNLYVCVHVYSFGITDSPGSIWTSCPARCLCGRPGTRWVWTSEPIRTSTMALKVVSSRHWVASYCAHLCTSLISHSPMAWWLWWFPSCAERTVCCCGTLWTSTALSMLLLATTMSCSSSSGGHRKKVTSHILMQAQHFYHIIDERDREREEDKERESL